MKIIQNNTNDKIAANEGKNANNGKENGSKEMMNDN